MWEFQSVDMYSLGARSMVHLECRGLLKTVDDRSGRPTLVTSTPWRQDSRRTPCVARTLWPNSFGTFHGVNNSSLPDLGHGNVRWYHALSHQTNVEESE